MINSLYPEIRKSILDTFFQSNLFLKYPLSIIFCIFSYYRHIRSLLHPCLLFFLIITIFTVLSPHFYQLFYFLHIPLSLSHIHSLIYSTKYPLTSDILTIIFLLLYLCFLYSPSLIHITLIVHAFLFSISFTNHVH